MCVIQAAKWAGRRIASMDLAYGPDPAKFRRDMRRVVQRALCAERRRWCARNAPKTGTFAQVPHCLMMGSVLMTTKICFDRNCMLIQWMPTMARDLHGTRRQYAPAGAGAARPVSLMESASDGMARNSRALSVRSLSIWRVAARTSSAASPVPCARATCSPLFATPWQPTTGRVARVCFVARSHPFL